MPSTLYYVRADATNGAGTSYGNQLSFRTKWDNSNITDFDGNVYATVQIGEQVWMAENLKTTKYNDGSSIPLETSNSTWAVLIPEQPMKVALQPFRVVTVTAMMVITTSRGTTVTGGPLQSTQLQVPGSGT